MLGSAYDGLEVSFFFLVIYYDSVVERWFGKEGEGRIMEIREREKTGMACVLFGQFIRENAGLD